MHKSITNYRSKNVIGSGLILVPEYSTIYIQTNTTT